MIRLALRGQVARGQLKGQVEIAIGSSMKDLAGFQGRRRSSNDAPHNPSNEELECWRPLLSEAGTHRIKQKFIVSTPRARSVVPELRLAALPQSVYSTLDFRAWHIGVFNIDGGFPPLSTTIVAARRRSLIGLHDIPQRQQAKWPSASMSCNSLFDIGPHGEAVPGAVSFDYAECAEGF